MIWRVVRRMIFSELYSTYYKVVGLIIKDALEKPITAQRLREIVENHAFGESLLTIEPSLREEKWQLLHKEGTTPLKSEPTMPFTLIQKRWLKAISLDPRIRLFGEESLAFDEDITPLFKPEDIYYFDQYADGDDFTDEEYIKTFRLILDALKNKYALRISSKNRKGHETKTTIMPHYLEYSEKDNKFRLIGASNKGGGTINISRIQSCELCKESGALTFSKAIPPKPRELMLDLWDERNALERALLHFAHLKKEVEKVEDKRYRLKLTYDKSDETEMVIRILGFGPFVKVVEPEHFKKLMIHRLMQQKSCEL